MLEVDLVALASIDAAPTIELVQACLTREEIEALARSADAPPAHAEACPRCRARLARARDERALLAELRTVAAPAPRLGVVPGYSIERELRRGGQGVVYAAVHAATRRRVALKMLIAGRDASATERRRFEREIELASRLDHPSIVPVYDSGTAAGSAWYAMQLVDGRSLDEWARDGAPTVRAKVELFERIASAVAHAHARGVIHRDLKPTNILIDAQSRPHVLDFGAALAADLDGVRLRVTAPGEFLGTLSYAAPEQLEGGASAIDTRTDVFALGLVFYEILTGELPRARRQSLAEIVASAREPAPRVSRSVRADADLDAIVAKALEPTPADRYASAQALQEDLERYLRGDAVEARGRGTAYVLRKALARHKRPVAAGVVIAVAAAVLVAAWLREHDRAERQHEQAEIVRAVFQDILSAAAPQRMGGDVRLLEVYELVARDVDDALRGAPDVQAAMEMTIGDTYRRLLRAPQAEQHLRKALERWRAIDDGSGRDVARCANLLSLALSDQNRPEAIPVAEEALGLRTRALSTADPLVGESRRTLAIALLSQFRDADMTRARRLLDEALAGFRASYGDDHPETADTQVWRARAGALEVGGIGETLSRAVATLERHAPRDARTIAARTAYAAFLQNASQFDAARTQLELAVVTTRELFGDALTTDLLRRRARLEFARGDARAAELLSRQAVAHELARWAGLRPDESTRLLALRARMEPADPNTTEVPFAEAFTELRRMEGDGSFELAQWMNGVALTLRAQGRHDGVEPLVRQALAIRCRALGRDCPVRQRSIDLLAEELRDARRGAEAVPLLVESLATYERRGESASVDAQHTRELLAACQEHAAPHARR